MNFSHVWKGLAVVAVLFLFSMEASAQLPVRTQFVQMINPIGGQVNFNLDGDADGPGPGAAAATTTYTVTWPTNAPNQPAGPGSGDQAILLGTWTGAVDVNLEWYEIDGFVDGAGATNHVTWWTDDNTVGYSDAFEWAANTLGVGTNAYAASLTNPTTGAAGPGTIHVGDGTNEQVMIAGATATVTVGNTAAATVQAGEVLIAGTTAAIGTTVNLDGASATATIGSVAAGAAGTVNVTSAAAGVNGAVIAGATGTATLGNATSLAGSVVLYDGDAAGQSATLTSGAQVADVDVTFDVPSLLAPAGARILPLSTNSATTQYYILISNGDGTATWSQNPAGQIRSGSVVPAANAYSGSVVFGGGGFIDPDGAGPLSGIPSVVITPNGNDAYIIQVTNITAAGFDWASTAPFDGTDAISWMANAVTQ